MGDSIYELLESATRVATTGAANVFGVEIGGTMKRRNAVLSVLGVILGCGGGTDPRDGTSRNTSTPGSTRLAEDTFSPNPQCTMPSTFDPTIGAPSADAIAQLAPTGTLRVGVYYGNTTITVCTGTGCPTAFNPNTQVLSGTSVDLACRLATQLKLPLQFTGYPTIATLVAGFQAGTWEIGFAEDPQFRLDPNAVGVDPYIGNDNTFLVPATSAFQTIQDMDQPGVNIVVQQSNLPDSFMRANFHHATLVELPTGNNTLDIFPLVKSGVCNIALCKTFGFFGLPIHASAGGRFGQTSFTFSNPAPWPSSPSGGRVLTPSLVLANLAPFVRSNNPNSLCYLTDYIEAAKTSGLLQAIVDRLPFQTISAPGSGSCTSNSQCLTGEVCSTSLQKCGLVGSFGRSVPAAQPTCAPNARCNSVTVSADGSCHAAASINAGSDDDDSDLEGCAQNPPGPYPLGATPVTLTCTDTEGQTSSCSATVTVVDTTPPVIVCPTSQTLECTDEGAIATFAPTVTDNCGVASVQCSPASGSTFPEAPSPTSVTCAAIDGAGNQSTCGFQIHVQDTLAPSVTTKSDANGFVASLWPPDHSLQTVSLSDCITNITDQCDGTAAATVVRVTSDELVKGNSKKSEDIVIVDGQTVQLRADRDGSGDGRVYTIFANVTDDDGNTTQVACKVQVPHDQFGVPAVDSGAVSCVGQGC